MIIRSWKKQKKTKKTWKKKHTNAYPYIFPNIQKNSTYYHQLYIIYYIYTYQLYNIYILCVYCMSTLYHIILPTDFRNSQKIPCISWDTQRWQTTRGKSFAASGDIRWRHHLRQRKNSNENGGFKTSKRSETVKPTMNSNYTTENQPTIKPESSEKRLHWPSFIIGSSKKMLYTPRKLTAGT